MTMVMIGVDPHKGSHTAVVVDRDENELSVLQRILGTTSLTGGQWLVCLLLAASLIVVEEMTKFVLRHREATHEDAT